MRADEPYVNNDVDTDPVTAGTDLVGLPAHADPGGDLRAAAQGRPLRGGDGRAPGRAPRMDGRGDRAGADGRVALLGDAGPHPRRQGPARGAPAPEPGDGGRRTGRLGVGRGHRHDAAGRPSRRHVRLSPRQGHASLGDPAGDPSRRTRSGARQRGKGVHRARHLQRRVPRAAGQRRADALAAGARQALLGARRCGDRDGRRGAGRHQPAPGAGRRPQRGQHAGAAQPDRRRAGRGAGPARSCCSGDRRRHRSSPARSSAPSSTTCTDEQGEAYLLYTLSGAPREAFEKFGHPAATALFGPTFTRRAADPHATTCCRTARYGRWAPHHGMPAGPPAGAQLPGGAGDGRARAR